MILEPYQLTLIGIYISILTLETVYPFRKKLFGKARLQHFGRNALFGLMNGFLITPLVAFLSAGVFIWVEINSIGLLNQLPLSAITMTFMAIVLFDFWIYIWHRLMHTVPFLWNFHQIHHSDSSVDLSTLFRQHPIEVFTQQALNIPIALLLGFHLEHIILYRIIFQATGSLAHCNISLPEKVDRIIRFVFVTPNMHRVHHSNIRDEADSNCSAIFSVWDRLFGTYKERDTLTISYGLKKSTEDNQQTVNELLKIPFQKNVTLNYLKSNLTSKIQF